MRFPAALLAGLLVALPGQAQPADEFALPSFTVDAGVPDPRPLSPPPLTSTPAEPAPSASLAQPGPPREPRWPRATISIAGTLSGRKEFTAGVEVFAGVAFGAPQVLSETSGVREVAGWIVVPGLTGAWSRLSGPVCAGSDFCGQRWTGGASARVGHATGTSTPDGVVALKRFFFGELSAQVGGVNVPPAPLTVGSRWAEGVFQLRGGVQLGTGGRNRQASSNLLVHLCALVEYLAFNPVGQGVQFGVVLGVGF
ncbi:MAG: hypothetical protein JNJ54_18630 [Myxococcaceae bacterium]|nr:hypothetical protein [Myxococcaceae bacterium]